MRSCWHLCFCCLYRCADIKDREHQTKADSSQLLFVVPSRSFKMFFTCFLIFATLLLAIKLKYAERNKALASFPIIKKVRLFQNLHGFFRSDKSREEFLLVKFTECHDELGEVFLIHLHPLHCGIVVITDPSVAEIVSFHQADRSRSLSYQVLSKLFGNGLFISAGKHLKVCMRAAKKTVFSHHSFERVRLT
jgi:hypothetical protein